MRLSPWSYRADFAVFPLLLAWVGVVSLRPASPSQTEMWLASALAGVGLWTLLEYALHRWLLHQLQPFKRLHDAHHANPSQLIGTPTWISASLFIAVWWYLLRELPRPAAGGATAGLMLGYLAYSMLHDAVHHWRAAPGGWLAHAKLRHARHHRAGARSDFGVTTDAWDRLFRTASTPSAAPVHRQARP